MAPGEAPGPGLINQSSRVQYTFCAWALRRGLCDNLNIHNDFDHNDKIKEHNKCLI